MNANAFRERLRARQAQNRIAFEGVYKEQLNSLMGLSKAEIDAITPDSTDLQAYDQLITVVKEASAANLSQAELKGHIEELGDVALTIAKKVPRLAQLF